MGLRTFEWTPNLKKLFVKYAEYSDPLTSDINSLKNIEIIRSGPYYSFIEDIAEIDLYYIPRILKK